MGLATVLEIVREHEGAMNVRSTPNVGSRFEAWLTCVAAATPVLAASRPPALPLGGGEMVLMIEDDREQRLRDEEILAALGYEPVGFARAEDAIASRLMASGRFDAIVIGGLPLLNSALACAASLRKAASDRPILMATASIDEIDANALIAAGISEIVSRPLLATEIAAALTRCLAARLTAASPADL